MPARRPFVMVPTDLLYDRGVSWPAKGLWQVLDDLCRSAAAARVPAPQLASAYGAAVRSVQRLAGELERAGWLRRHRLRYVVAYEPLNRARPHAGAQLGLFEMRQSWPTSPASDATDLAHLPRSALHTARAEAEAGSAWTTDATRRLPACGRCDPATRLLEVDGGGVARCPDCHPLAAPRF